jgi:hypothetical protein
MAKYLDKNGKWPELCVSWSKAESLIIPSNTLNLHPGKETTKKTRNKKYIGCFIIQIKVIGSN